MNQILYLRITQIGSPIGRPRVQYESLKGLGLGKIGRTRDLVDTPRVRGLLKRVAHLVDVSFLSEQSRSQPLRKT